jgi:death-on-curing protein
MELSTSELQEDYNRWLDKIGEDKYKGVNTLGIIDVLKAHYLIVDYFSTNIGQGIGGIGPKDLNLLHSALGRQQTGFEGKKKWTTNFEICATLFYGLIKDHAFHDANKRTAFLSLLYHLLIINRTPNTRQKEFEQLALRIATNQLSLYPSYSQFIGTQDSEIKFISFFLRRNTREINKNEYFVTYRDLNTILGKWDFGLINPDKNRIELVKYERETRGKGLFKKETIIIPKRYTSIDFPGWGRQVCLNEIKKIRKITNLNTENGVDSSTFFRGAEPLSALISIYENPLRKLADK